jgi:hypothetical protein
VGDRVGASQVQKLVVEGNDPNGVHGLVCDENGSTELEMHPHNINREFYIFVVPYIINLFYEITNVMQL